MKDKRKIVRFLNFINFNIILPRPLSFWQVSVIICAFTFFGAANSAHAVLPPDFIFNIGSHITQILSLAVIGLSGGLIALKNFVNATRVEIKSKKFLWIGGIAVIALLTALIIFGYILYQSKKL